MNAFITRGVLIIVLLLASSPAQAQDCGMFGCIEAPIPGIDADTPIGDIAEAGVVSYVGTVAFFVTSLIVMAGLLAVVVGGYIYMTAGGSAERVTLAKTIIGSALLGITLALTSWLILNTINPQIGEQLEEPVIGG